uniref:Uncharacterized protein n=1 Tax=Xenopus tropicalis TaxID=8364 RepID=A0A1B8Y9M4_XENTR
MCLPQIITTTITLFTIVPITIILIKIILIAIVLPTLQTTPIPGSQSVLHVSRMAITSQLCIATPPRDRISLHAPLTFVRCLIQLLSPFCAVLSPSFCIGGCGLFYPAFRSPPIGSLHPAYSPPPRGPPNPPPLFRCTYRALPLFLATFRTPSAVIWKSSAILWCRTVSPHYFANPSLHLTFGVPLLLQKIPHLPLLRGS